MKVNNVVFTFYIKLGVANLIDLKKTHRQISYSLNI